MSLTKKVMNGGAWIFGLRISRRFLDFMRTVILAHFLAPHDFGLMGIAILALQTLEAFSQTGFQSALVRKIDDIAGHLNVAWTVLVLRGIFLFVAMLVFSPWVAKFFNSPGATLLIQVVGLSFLLQGFTNIGIVFFQKELEFKKQYLYEFAGVVFDFLLSVILVFVMKSVWALIVGKITGEMARLIASYALSAFRPHFEFNRAKFHELHNFGRWVSGVNIIAYMCAQGDSIIVGRVFGPASLGIYKLGSTIANMPTTEITSVISQVAFPAYAKIQDDIERVRSGFYKTLFFTGMLSALLTSLIYALTPDFTKAFLGEKWLPIIPVVQILVIAGFVRSLAAIPGPIFQAIGKPHLDTYAQIIRLAGLLISLFPLSKIFGIDGVAYSVLISIFCVFLYLYYFAVRIFNLNVRLLLKILTSPIIPGVALTFIVTLIRYVLNFSPVIDLIVLALTSFFVFVGLIILQERTNPEYKLTSFLADFFRAKIKQ